MRPRDTDDLERMTRQFRVMVVVLLVLCPLLALAGWMFDQLTLLMLGILMFLATPLLWFQWRRSAQLWESQMVEEP